MKKGIYFVFLLFILNCDKNHKTSLNSNETITTKYIVWDENSSPNYINCSEEINFFENMSKFDCSFKIEKFEFDIKEKFIINKKGNLKEYWVYKHEGPLTYSLKELNSDPKYLELIGGSILNIKLFDDGSKIIDKNDTLTIERVFTNQKMILTKQSNELKKLGQRFLFEYQ